MRRQLRNLFLLGFVGLLTTACTSSAGYFVRDIRVVRPGVLLVEQCEVQNTSFGDLSQMSTGNCQAKEVRFESNGRAAGEQSEAVADSDR